MERLLLAAVLVVVAAVIAMVLRRRTAPDTPVQGKQWAVPGQLRRSDFAEPERPWLLAVFTSETCGTCASAWEKVSGLACGEIAVQNVPWPQERMLHERYGIDAVPTTVIAGADGAVVASFVGEPDAGELEAVIARLRAEGYGHDGCGGDGCGHRCGHGDCAEASGTDGAAAQGR